MTTSTAIATLVSASIGQLVVATAKDGVQSRYLITKLSDKVGTLKDGSKGEYVVLTREDNVAVVVNIHPQMAKRLLTKGEDSGFKLLKETADIGTIADSLSASEEEGLQDELTAFTALEPANKETKPEEVAPVVAKVKTKAAVADKAPSKTELSFAIYKNGIKAGKSRQEILAQFRVELEMGIPGSHTYYQMAKKKADVESV